ncbi:sugar ABC transporter substrate-binding protein [Christensenellaceae bacterium NSJ-44]|uniref:Sugar ABC transporter substrate-binding protein n=1 Tax=Luoshenia tenuis TaxID=2763654 RepID=A0A926D0Z0_9FIRM|nr:sugar ABC transporter substrate-binding protein [Luoshenia tenuis]
MEKFRSLSICLLLAAALMVSAVGCQQPDEGQTQPTGGGESKQPVTLTFWDMAWGTADRYVPAAEQIIANYKEVAPHVTINYTNLPWSNWFEAYSTAVASNGAPDVATGGGYMPFQFATSDEAADLQWIVDQWEKEGTLEDFPEGFMEYYRFKDKQVGICFNVDPRGILVRKDWLEEKGLAEPTNWDEFLEMCKAFTDKEKGTYGFAYGVAVDSAGSFTNWAVNNGGLSFDREGNAAVDTERNLQTMQFFSDLKKAGVLPEGIENYSGSDAQKLFGAGKVGAVYGGSDWAEIIMSSSGLTEDQLTILHPLTSPSGIQKNALYFNGYMMFEQSSLKQEGLNFIKWWSENNQLLWEEGGMSAFPARTSFMNSLSVFQKPVSKKPFVEYIIPNSVQTVYPMQSGTPSASMVEGQKYDMQMMQSALTQEEKSWQTLLKKLQAELEGTIQSMDQ